MNYTYKYKYLKKMCLGNNTLGVKGLKNDSVISSISKRGAVVTLFCSMLARGSLSFFIQTHSLKNCFILVAFNSEKDFGFSSFFVHFISYDRHFIWNWWLWFFLGQHVLHFRDSFLRQRASFTFVQVKNFSWFISY